MIDDSPLALKAIEEMVDCISSLKDLPTELKHGVVAKAKRYLRAINGDLDASLGVFDDSGLDELDAESECIDDLINRKPKGELAASIAILERFGQDRGWGTPAMEQEKNRVSVRLNKVQCAIDNLQTKKLNK